MNKPTFLKDLFMCERELQGMGREGGGRNRENVSKPGKTPPRSPTCLAGMQVLGSRFAACPGILLERLDWK